ncbi:hypothetical protein kam1_1668 [Methylacidiphilum kamchatkense Kam1]|uniref:Uncharacterized protein n=1 Tax=Methylacidiphilum kamchatkense Kam1 TaxID=1202785 RepID=A0A516TNQ8_9BACT|nr:hypothetical protein kam1_1668 [Methylacidiphilum kamchatkense Kam1]
MAFLRDLEDFSPHVIILSFTLCVLIIIIFLLSWYSFFFNRSPFELILKHTDFDFSGNVYYWISVIFFLL